MYLWFSLSNRGFGVILSTLVDQLTNSFGKNHHVNRKFHVYHTIPHMNVSIYMVVLTETINK